MLRFLPDDINIEDILTYLPIDSYKVSIDGLHKRNAYKDIINYEDNSEGKTIFHIGRNGIYNSLPEYMFHSVNRFENIPEREYEEKFTEECTKLKKEKEEAHKFFEPFDNLLLTIKTRAKEELNQYYHDNKILLEILCDSLSKEEKENRFIKRVIPFMPYCKIIRGNKTLITFILRKILLEENLTLVKEMKPNTFKDRNNKYNCNIDNESLEFFYVGNEYEENVTTFTIQYWSEEDCTETFNIFLNDLECFRIFLQDYFFSIEDLLKFNIVTNTAPLRLSDNIIYNYLNFNTNI